jgi:hypothetical protein
MSTQDTTPEQDPAPKKVRQITVDVPAHRVEQFERFHQRFLEMAAHWDDQVGREDLRGPRGRRGRHRHGGGRPHGEGRGRCGSRPAETDATA